MPARAPRTREGIALLGAALGLGVAGDLLVRTVPGRLDMALGLGAFLLALTALAQTESVTLPRGLAPLGLPLAPFGLALIWRDSPALFALNLVGIASVAVLAAPCVRAVGRRRAGIGTLLRGAGDVAVGGASGAAVLMLSDIDWASLPLDARARRARGAAVGVVAAAPVAAVFGGLLMHADPVYARLLGGLVDVNVASLAGHVAIAVVCAWLAAGLLRVVTRPDETPAPAVARGRLGLGEVGPVIFAVDLLFLGFVLVQFRYLFGGAALVQGLTGLSYAEYARHGFFELVAVAALSLPLLLVADWVLDHRDAARVRRFRLLAGTMLVLLNVMLASALYRMRLYTAEYGLTELRFYTTAFMGWLVLVFGWCVATVLRGRRERFGIGALAAGWLVLGVLNLLSPDDLIASVNIERAAGGRAFDAAYAAGLSADALPRLQRELGRLAPSDACAAARALDARWAPLLDHPHRWTIGLSRARRGWSPLGPTRERAGCGAVPEG